MKTISRPHFSVRPALWRTLLAGLMLLLAVQFPALAQEQRHYLAAAHPDGVALLPPPPAPDSAEQAADLAAVLSVFKSRSNGEEARANKDYSLNFSLFAPAIGPAFDLSKLPKTQALLDRVKKEIGQPIDITKDYFKRLRPYQIDTNLNLGKPEPSFSYPSGHSTRGTVYALVLAELFPGKKDAILAVGRQIGWDRVLLGKHYPTDIYAGRVFGQAIVHELLQSASFQEDLAQAKAEIAAVIRSP